MGKSETQRVNPYVCIGVEINWTREDKRNLLMALHREAEKNARKKVESSRQGEKHTPSSD